MNVNVNYDPMAGSEQVKRTCPECETVHFITVDKEGYARWKAGELLQNALPDLSADDRETLLTGICPPCWDRLLPPEEGEEEYPADEDGPVKCGSLEVLNWPKKNGHLGGDAA